MSIHDPSIGGSDEWYTPSRVFDAMGARFDLDVAHPGTHVVRWVPAREVLTANGLAAPWRGFVWMNPPFGGRNAIVPWLERFFAHGDGVALTPDRTSAPWWHLFAPRADAVLFVRSKIRFIPGPGVSDKGGPGQGTTLMALGPRGVAALERAESAGLGTCFRAVRR